MKIRQPTWGQDGRFNETDIPVTTRQLNEWRYGNRKMDEAMPNLTPEQREVIQTGLTPEQWAWMFGGE